MLSSSLEVVCVSSVFPRLKSKKVLVRWGSRWHPWVLQDSSKNTSAAPPVCGAAIPIGTVPGGQAHGLRCCWLGWLWWLVVAVVVVVVQGGGSVVVSVVVDFWR